MEDGCSNDDYTDRFQQIEQLHIVMDEYKIKLPEKNKSKFKDTHSALKSVDISSKKALKLERLMRLGLKRSWIVKFLSLNIVLKSANLILLIHFFLRKILQCLSQLSL
jgi:uncharacterized membrane protein